MYRLCRSRLLLQATSKTFSRQFLVPQITRPVCPVAEALSCRSYSTSSLSSVNQDEQSYPKVYVLKPRYGKGSGFLFFYAHRRVVVQAARETPSLKRVPLNLCETFDWFEDGKPSHTIILNAADVSRILTVLSGKEKRHEVIKLIPKGEKTGGSVLQISAFVPRAQTQANTEVEQSSDSEIIDSDDNTAASKTVGEKARPKSDQKWSFTFRVTLASKLDVQTPSTTDEFSRIVTHLDSADTVLLVEFLKESLVGMMGFGEDEIEHQRQLPRISSSSEEKDDSLNTEDNDSDHTQPKQKIEKKSDPTHKKRFRPKDTRAKKAQQSQAHSQPQTNQVAAS